MEQRFSSNREERPCLCSGGDVAPATHGPLPCCPWDRKTGARSHGLTRVRAAVGLVPNNTHPRLMGLSEHPASHRETVVAELRGHSHLLCFHVLYLDTYQLRLP